MEKVYTSRRTLVASGLFAAAAATLVGAGAWWRQGAAVSKRDALAVMPGEGAPLVGPGAPGVANLAHLVGQVVRIGGTFGAATATVVAATPLPTRGARPAGVRTAPYRLTLHAARADAPEGDESYALSAPIDGMDRLHLVRGADVGDQAVLMAVVA